MSKFLLNSNKIAAYSNNNPNSALNTLPKYAVIAISVAIFAAGIIVFGAAIVATVI